MKFCSIEGCGKIYHCRGYCEKHYRQVSLHGNILIRTNLSPNEFIIDGDICWIILYNKKCEEVSRAKIDIKYFEQIKRSKLKWRLNKKGYVYSTWQNGEKRQIIYLHEAIIQLSDQVVPDGYKIDHKNRVPLDNLENNLRICTNSQNQQNKSISPKNTTGYKGVYFNKKTNRWLARIQVNYISIHLGIFTTKEDAARAYNDAAIKYHGEFAVLNEIL